MTKTTHSVLGGNFTSPDMSHNAMLKASLFTAPMTWGARYLHICLYTTAFIITVAFVSRIQDHKEPGFADAMSSLRLSLRSIFWFALKIFAFCILAAILMALVPASVISFFYETKSLGAAAFGSIIAFFISVCIAWLLTPAGIRLIQASHSQRISAESIKQGRIFAILAVLASIVLSYFSMKAEASLYASSDFNPAFIQLAIMPVFSLLVSLPYMLLWIALSLLAGVGIQEPEVQTSYEDNTLPYAHG